ncbi:SLBB domain-containing protein [Pseudoalteromonas rubra]|uniref:Polysaccharide biosynthesis protein n=1 Tax=Pseudoalteromonas rubra TaxID=43658 RepID=A0A0F4QNN0_9GAMM|nr:SLBB domain-containing protein [Pseudoalteromonas rubra]KJZ09308.1 polysaccharide biosynthesis protein [Pseudoalteromonas rubra]
MSFKRIFAATMLVFSAVSIAFTPTAQQIEQFKKLPKSQQQALAKQYGFDLSALSKSSFSNSTDMNSNTPSVYPRQSEHSNEAEVDPMAPKEPKLKPFGYELFAGEPTSFAPNEMRSVPSDYIISSGDAITISFYGKETATHTVTVDREGRLSIPDFAPINVVGLTYSELKHLIENKIKSEAIGLNAFVSIAELRSIQVLVVGEAYRPGSYTLSPLSNVTHALFASGGPTQIASLRNIEVKRQGQTVSVLDLYDLLLRGDSSNDVTLQSGDVVFLPSVGPQVTVTGQVKRPGIFEMKQGDTAKELIHMFGGFAEDAFIENVQVNRIFNNKAKSVTSIDFSDNSADYTPRGGDEINVQAINDEIVNSVTLIGAVARPGYYEWYEGATLDSYITSLKTDLLPQADLSYAIVVREKELPGQIEVLQFVLSEALSGVPVPLERNDEVYIFSRFNSLLEEEKALENLAITAEERELQEKVKLWHLYERRQFDKKVTFDEAISKAKNPPTTTEQEEELADYTPAVFSRENLLAPVLSKLDYQASTVKQNLTINVTGQVRFPGQYPVSRDMSTIDAIRAAGGLLESAYTEFAEVTRINDKGEVLHAKSSLIKGADQYNIKLIGRDTLNILMQPNWQDSFKVSLIGEVRFPGEYVVKRGDTLIDVLNRAGGITKYADENAAIFTRESIREQEREQLSRLSDELRKDMAARSFQKSIGVNNSLSYNETDKLLRDLAKAEAVGRLVIDLPSILSRSDSLTLQKGDKLYLPGKQDSISIIGEVNYSSSHLFKAGRTIDEYISLSGGIRDRADEDKVYVIKANGEVQIPNRGSWFAVNNRVELEAGDTIVVPMDSSHMDNLTLWSTATQIFYQLGVGIAAIAAL